MLSFLEKVSESFVLFVLGVGLIAAAMIIRTAITQPGSNHTEEGPQGIDR